MPFDDTSRDGGDHGGEYRFAMPEAAEAGWFCKGFCDEFIVTFIAAGPIAALTIVTLRINPLGSTVTYAVGDASITTAAEIEWRERR